ncbi:MAG: hypothetical protein M4579_000926 [Chaenotheca gracillima]|nr:MAG: hypothetical protein M4579_000926 [Chaenotheca gracillima]
MLFRNGILLNVGLAAFAASQQLLTDSGTAGPPLELVHVYYDEFPTGIAVSSTGRLFSNYPPGLDANNTYNGTVPKYTVAELTSNNTEKAYPSVEMNSPPGGAINYTTIPATGANYPNYLIGVQSVVIDSKDRLWILDTGRAAMFNGTNVPASYGGPKLIGVDLKNNSIFTTIVFNPNVAYPESYLNDVRFDLRPELTSSGQGVAYITDSSTEGRNGLITVDLGTGEAWRHLDSSPTTKAEQGFVPFVWGEALYSNPNPATTPITPQTIGSDGIALSADGADLYWTLEAGRTLYSIPTARLRDHGPTSEIMAQASISNHGEKGNTDGMETDSNGLIYAGSMESNAINIFHPSNGTVSVFVRDPRFSWTDTMSVSNDGYLYFTENQLWRAPMFQGGVDRRVKPFALFKVKLPGNGTKVSLM